MEPLFWELGLLAIAALVVWVMIRLWKRRRKVAAVAFGLVAGLFIAVYGLPIVMIVRNLSYGNQVKDELLTSLRTRYPDRDFQIGVGYQRPDLYVHVLGKLDAAQQGAIKEFLIAESKQQLIDASVWLQFDAVDGQGGAPEKIHETR